jgi:NAD(P)-dependent dehydrogenase (short-subunit alcohol dehydrogenase family)
VRVEAGVTLRRELNGKVALVTGGASGIGLACARELSRRGARVAVADADAARLSRLARRFGRANLYAIDVADPAAVRRAVADLTRRERRLDILVLAAGICRDAVLWKMTDEAWSRVIDVDLSGAANVLRAAAPALRRQRRGRVVLISSINGRRGKFGQSNYAAAKAGLLGLARSAARELAGSGVTVNVVEPGFTTTPMTAGLPSRIRRRALAEIPLGRVGKPEDIAAAVAFFVSPAASHITGQSLAVDGGQAMGA